MRNFPPQATPTDEPTLAPTPCEDRTSPPAPALAGARVTDDLGRVRLALDKNSDRGVFGKRGLELGKAFACRDAFRGFGEESCRFVEADTIDATLDSTSTLRVADQVSLRDYALAAEGVCGPLNAGGGAVAVRAPEQAQALEVAIDGARRRPAVPARRPKADALQL